MFAKFKANFSQFFSIFDIECHHQTYVNPIQDGVGGGGGGQKGTPYHFYPCNFNKRSTYLQKLFEF